MSWQRDHAKKAAQEQNSNSSTWQARAEDALKRLETKMGAERFETWRERNISDGDSWVAVATKANAGLLAQAKSATAKPAITPDMVWMAKRDCGIAWGVAKRSDWAEFLALVEAVNPDLENQVRIYRLARVQVISYPDSSLDTITQVAGLQGSEA